MKNKLALLLAFFLSLLSVPVFAEETPLVEASKPKKLSGSQLEHLSQNCGTIRQSLKLLQRSDSHARTYFGAIYETVSSKYLTPLNLRLVKNDISSVSLINAQSSLAATRANFSDDFIDYSKSLEELIAIDCNLEPALFYEKLETTRQKRQLVAEDMETLNIILTNSYKSVEKLKEGLKNDQ